MPRQGRTSRPLKSNVDYRIGPAYLGDTREIHDVVDLTAGDLMHRHVSSLPATTRIAELRDYFAASGSRKLAVIVDGDRFVKSIERHAVTALDDDSTVAAHADQTHWTPAHAPAGTARDRALAHPSRRLPVVDASGALAGIIAINGRDDGFCGT